MDAGAAVSVRVLHGDCLEVLATLPDASVDAVVTDPPYGLTEIRETDVRDALTKWLAGEPYRPKKRGFMGRGWDAFVPGPEVWRECLRVLKPGGHLAVFAGTRTVDLMALGLRLAGAQIRDEIAWLYGSGFPKSLDVSKAIDKMHGAEREPDAARWSGWGTALKPAHEPIIIARKPLVGTVARNVLEHGTGAINVDGCRVPGAYETRDRDTSPGRSMFGTGKGGGAFVPAEGRWPPNVLLDSAAGAMLDEQSGERTSGVKVGGGYGRGAGVSVEGHKRDGTSCYGDSGGASRFFPCLDLAEEDLTAFRYEAKASRSERGEGNIHPTVKPIAVMRWLCRLLTPPGGTVLDPFAGSGTTLLAAQAEGFEAVGIEMEAAHVEIINARLAKPPKSKPAKKRPTVTVTEPARPARQPRAADRACRPPAQLGLFGGDDR